MASDFQEGSAITLFQSNLYFNRACTLEYDHTKSGGAIHSTESKLYFNGNVTNNTAARNGGGVYLSTSELNCQQNSTFLLINNTAVNKGGGLHAISSSIKATSDFTRYTGTKINLTNNVANRGGGLSLEANDPAVALTAITFTVCCILALRIFIGNRLYRKWPVDLLEMFLFLNILFLAIFISYILSNTNSNQEACSCLHFSHCHIYCTTGHHPLSCVHIHHSLFKD